MPQPRHVEATTAAALNGWANQRRRLLAGTSEPLRCLLGQRVAMAGAGGGPRRQHWAEAITGEALLVNGVVNTLPEVPQLVVTFFYCLRPWHVPVSEQAREIGIPAAGLLE